MGADADAADRDSALVNLAVTPAVFFPVYPFSMPDRPLPQWRRHPVGYDPVLLGSSPS